MSECITSAAISFLDFLAVERPRLPILSFCQYFLIYSASLGIGVKKLSLL